jgi:Uma2 family endonuclease
MSTAEMSGPASDLLTFDDFCAIVRDGQKADLLDGVIYMASPDSKRSNQINGFLDRLLGMYIAARGIGGEVYVNRFAFQLDESNGPEPDLAWVAPDRMHLVEEGRMRGAPTVAVEIVSRDSRQRDWVDKRMKYEAAGVEEYWIIDPIQRRCEFLRRQANGRYDVVPLEENRIFRSTAIPGFWLNIEWLQMAPLPNVYQCLQELLADG